MPPSGDVFESLNLGCLIDNLSDVAEPDILSSLLLQEDPDGLDTQFLLFDNSPVEASIASRHVDKEEEKSTLALSRSTRRKAQKANNARYMRQRKKIELEALRKDERFLREQLEAFVTAQSTSRFQWKAAAEMELSKRIQAENVNDQLRRKLYQQSRLLRRASLVLPSPLPYRVEVNMRNFLHTATKLSGDSQARARSLDAACTDAKLDLAAQILLSETGNGHPFTTPSFSWELLNLGLLEFGTSSIAMFALDTVDTSMAFQAALNSLATCEIIWPSYSLMCSSVKQIEVLSTKLDVQYNATEHRFTSMSGEQVALESRFIAYGRAGETQNMFLWDFVDEDDLYPLEKTTAIKRNVVGAVLVRIEKCDDGVERAVCRYICTKIHTINSRVLPPDVQRFSLSSQLGARVVDSMIYEAIKGLVLPDTT